MVAPSSADEKEAAASFAADATNLGLRQRRGGGGGGASSSQPQEPPQSTTTSSRRSPGDYDGDYLSDYESLLTKDDTARTEGGRRPLPSEVVEKMKRTGGRPTSGSVKKSSDDVTSNRVTFDQSAPNVQTIPGTTTATSSSASDKAFSHLASGSRSAAAASRSGSNSGGGTVQSSNALLDRHAESILQVDEHFRMSALAVLCVYPLLVSLSYKLCPTEQIQPLEGIEKNAAGMAAILVFVSCISILLPLLYRGRKRAFSGVIIGALTVQTVAFISDVLMATVAVPVMIDPVAGSRVHLLRWCEWTPLAFLMTFLTEGVGVPDGGDEEGGTSKSGKKRFWRSTHLLAAYGNGLAQGFSTLCGLIFPFCPGLKSWMFFMIVSCLLFLVIYYRLNVKIKRHKQMDCGTSVDEIEVYNRSLLSLKLLGTCTFLWTALVCSYFISTVGPMIFTNIERLQVDSLTMVCECTMDVVAKVLYMFIIVDVHDQVFDQGARAERRLEELRQMMAVVWDNSSDVIGISVRSVNGTVTTMLSPTYLKIYQRRKTKLSEAPNDSSNDMPPHREANESQGNALIFELDAKEFIREDEEEKVQASARHGTKHRRTSFHEAQEASPSAFKEASSKVLGKNCSTGEVGRIVEPKIVYNIEFAAASKRRRSSRRGSDIDETNEGGDNAEERTRRRAYGNVTGYAAPERPDICPQEFSSVAELVVRAWELDSKETLLMQDLVLIQNTEEHVIRCEAKVTRLEENALVIVVRDISERFRRFEAEKKVISETTAREKDAEANRFTRHEVKNGLLAAIGLCDSLRDTLIGKDALSPRAAIIGGNNSGRPGDDMSTSGKNGQVMALRSTLSSLQNQPLSGGNSAADLITDLGRCLGELHKTLHEVLDTILAEAMARDVIHEVYEPKVEKVDISSILCGSNISVFKDSRLERFPLLTHPNPLPLFAFDPQLLKHIHRNAISNGCKYGKKGGLVLTEVHYDAKAGTFHMDVINLPGEHHDKILSMGEAASVAVFSPRKRLHSEFNHSRNRSEFIESHSSGDGAWIMHKCAKTLGGECSIRFETHRTVFSLRCPITTFDDAVNKNTSVHPSNFKLPDNVWGIAIDDSKIQRKLLGRFLQLAGVKEDRCIIQGGTMQEIKCFDDFVVDHIEHYPNDYFVIIADENLDVTDEMAKHVTISGSMCIENIRHRLLPDQERRMLALVRSANDSSRDIAIYNSRSHGFLPKAPIKRQRVLEMLAPAWEKRFPPGGWADEDAHTNVVEPDVPSLESEPVRGEDDQDLLVDMSELRAEVDQLHTMCSADDDTLAERWPMIWERLHALKGDLKSLPSNGRASAAVETISSLRGATLPHNFSGKWVTIHALVKSLWS